MNCYMQYVYAHSSVDLLATFYYSLQYLYRGVLWHLNVMPTRHSVTPDSVHKYNAANTTLIRIQRTSYAHPNCYRQATREWFAPAHQLPCKICRPKLPSLH